MAVAMHIACGLCHLATNSVDRMRPLCVSFDSFKGWGVQQRLTDVPAELPGCLQLSIENEKCKGRAAV